MKKTVAIIGMLMMISLIASSIHDFNQADNAIGIFKGLFWLIIGVLAFCSFLDDFKQNKWPF